MPGLKAVTNANDLLASSTKTYWCAETIGRDLAISRLRGVAFAPAADLRLL